MSKRSLFILSFLFVFTFFGTIGTISEINAKSQSKIEDLNQSKKKKKTTKKKGPKKKTTKKKKVSSGKKKAVNKKTNKKKVSKKKTGKKITSKKKKGKKKYSAKKKKKNNNSSRNNTGVYNPPKTYDSGSDGSREYKRSEDKPVENFRKEPKKDGE